MAKAVRCCDDKGEVSGQDGGEVGGTEGLVGFKLG